MYYLIEKSGMYLSVVGDFHSVWYLSEDQARKFWNKEDAQKTAETVEAHILSRVALS